MFVSQQYAIVNHSTVHQNTIRTIKPKGMLWRRKKNKMCLERKRSFGTRGEKTIRRGRCVPVRHDAAGTRIPSSLALVECHTSGHPAFAPHHPARRLRDSGSPSGWRVPERAAGPTTPSTAMWEAIYGLLGENTQDTVCLIMNLLPPLERGYQQQATLSRCRAINMARPHALVIDAGAGSRDRTSFPRVERTPRQLV